MVEGGFDLVEAAVELVPAFLAEDFESLRLGFAPEGQCGLKRFAAGGGERGEHLAFVLFVCGEGDEAVLGEGFEAAREGGAVDAGLAREGNEGCAVLQRDGVQQCELGGAQAGGAEDVVVEPGDAAGGAAKVSADTVERVGVVFCGLCRVRFFRGRHERSIAVRGERALADFAEQLRGMGSGLILAA